VGFPLLHKQRQTARFSTDPHSPNPAHFVRIEDLIIADLRQIFCLTLRHQHPVERVLVRPGQKSCPDGVVGGDI
jgi:hypothetical protein